MAVRSARTCIKQLYADTGCSLEDLLGAMDDRDGWWEGFWKFCAGDTTSWWWNIYIYLYMCVFWQHFLLIHIWLNNIDIFCLHISVFILLSRWIDFMVFGGFKLNYPIEMTHYASLWYQFKSTTSKKHSCPKTEFRKILTKNTILEKKITEYPIRNSIKSISNPVLMYLNVFSFCC